MARQAGLIKNDDVIQIFPANGADHPFDIRALPGRAWGGQHLFDSHRFHLLHKLLAEDPIAIAEEIAGRRVPGKRFPELVRGPCGGRMGGDREMQNAPPVVCQHQEYIENLKAESRHREKVDRHHAGHVILQERPPRLRRWSPAADQVLAHARFANVDTQLEQFAVNPRRAPEGIFPAHRADQVANRFRHGGASGLAPSNFPGPKLTECLPVPSNNRRRLDEKDTSPPVLPDGAEPSPQESIRRGELGPFDGALQNPELMAERQNFQLQRRAAPERGSKRGEER